ncbi:MAG: PAS domain S-box protein [Dehalococcoidia bacterium]|nr:PAS domain S-box protein [Dehalococcoidia bacterium]
MNLITRLKHPFTRAGACPKQHFSAGTGRKQAEVEKAPYRNLVEQADDGICIIQDAIIRYANPASLKIIGTPIARYVHPDALDAVMVRYQKRMSGKDAPSRYESAFVHRDDRKVPVEINASATSFNNKPADLVIGGLSPSKSRWMQKSENPDFWGSVIENTPYPMRSLTKRERLSMRLPFRGKHRAPTGGGGAE